MIIHNTDFAFIGLTVARIASQLREGINVNATTSFGSKLGTYVIFSIFDEDKCLTSFHLSGYNSPRDMMDAAFAYCLENQLFKIPMDITLVD